jgi:hypothetical protein
VHIRIFLNGEELTDEKLTVEEARLLEAGASIVVEPNIKVHIEVLGKGKGYQSEVLVRPGDPVGVLKQKVHFLKTFLARKHVVADKADTLVIEDFTRSFNHYRLKDGA